MQAPASQGGWGQLCHSQLIAWPCECMLGLHSQQVKAQVKALEA